MATLRMKNFRILKVQDGKQNAGTYYVKADVYDPKNETAEYPEVNRFGKNFVTTIRNAFPSTGTYLAEDGTQQPWNGLNPNVAATTSREDIEKAIPLSAKRIVNAKYVAVYLGGEYARIYGTPRKDRNGVEHAADDFICEADGTIKVYNEQSVLTSEEYEWVNATDQFGNVIPNPKFETGESDDEFVQTIKKDEHGVPVMHEVKGWESKPAAESIKQAFMVSIEKAIEKVKANGHPEMIPYKYRGTTEVHTAEAEAPSF